VSSKDDIRFVWDCTVQQFKWQTNMFTLNRTHKHLNAFNHKKFGGFATAECLSENISNYSYLLQAGA
jgi:hypothetical protein